MAKNIIVIGGGPAGLEASARLDALGYTVFLVERDNHLGGHLALWDRLFPSGDPAEPVLRGLVSKTGSTKILLESEVQTLNRLGKSFRISLSSGVSVIADAVLLTTGFDLFDASKKEEYGYGIYDHVVTNADIESYFRTGKDPRIDNPERIGIVHCVGSRDEKAGCRNCSKVCCATAVKQACELKAKFPKAKVYCFYMDLRMFGRGYEDLYLKAQKEYGVRFIRGRVSEVSEKIDKTLQVKAEDTLSSTPLKVSLDLLVLMAGMRPSKSGSKVAKMIRLDTGEDGYLSVADGFTGMQATTIPGLFVAGAATGPKTLPETLAEARAASALIHDYLKG
ncbi:MAG: CoB--CoM heterodisulfide reductase iron-sulfur subunit A family protein [Bacteroidales bacterium]|nr:CoB--CoM heterodisulfide reductase iron-sulfur subunit A family protein [Bacteroidales bacterium]